MVNLDPCIRLKTIQHQLIPSILSSAIENTTSDIKTATDHNLASLEKNCYILAEKCLLMKPDCGKEIELCDKENIKKLFAQTRERLEKIWEEKKKLEKETSSHVQF